MFWPACLPDSQNARLAERRVIMRNIPKFLLVVMVLSCLTALPAKESSAQEDSLPDTESIQATSASALDTPLYGSSSFNADARLSKCNKDILQGDTYTVKLLDAEDDCNISFSSSDSDILSVKKSSNCSCTYKGVGYGSAKIVVKITRTTAFFFKETKTLRAKINVTPRAVSVMFRKNVRKIAVGKKCRLPLTIRPSISEEVPDFESLNPKIASISKKGVVTGKRVGKTYVTATISNGQTAKCKINVVEPPKDKDDGDDEEDN